MRSTYKDLNGESFLFAAEAEKFVSDPHIALFSPGYGGSVGSCLNGETGNMLRKVAAKCPVAVLNAGGTNTMGNDAAINSIEAAVATMRARNAGKKFLIVGLSMGFADLMGWARLHPGEVAAAIGVVGLADLNAVYAANADLGGGVMAQAEINAAYGGLYDPATMAATRSPIAYTEALGFPVTYLYSTDDPLIAPASSVAYGALANVSEFSLGAVQHGSAAIGAAHAHAKFAEAVSTYAAL